MAKKLAYLGPAGTFTEEAALRHDPEAQLIPFAAIPAVATAVTSGMAEEGVVPIENSLEGSVPDTLDLLINETSLYIRRELVLPIEHCLLVNPGVEAASIATILSHPQALAQCRRFLERCFPKCQVVASLSTAAAVEEMKHNSSAAAIANRRAAELYGAQVLASGIQVSASNVTRFVVLGPEDHPWTGADKTSLCFSFDEDKPGQLHFVINEFAVRNINLAKIESRPTKESLGTYVFLLDLEGHKEDPQVREALSKIESHASMLRIFGSYPKYKAPEA